MWLRKGRKKSNNTWKVRSDFSFVAKSTFEVSLPWQRIDKDPDERGAGDGANEVDGGQDVAVLVRDREARGVNRRVRAKVRPAKARVHIGQVGVVRSEYWKKKSLVREVSWDSCVIICWPVDEMTFPQTVELWKKRKKMPKKRTMIWSWWRPVKWA